MNKRLEVYASALQEALRLFLEKPTARLRDAIHTHTENYQTIWIESQTEEDRK